MIKRKLRSNIAFLFILPSLLGFLLFFVVPFIMSLGYAVQDKSVNGSFVGLQNFFDLFSNPTYLLGLGNTARFIGIAVPLGILLSLLSALQIKKLTKHRDLITLFFLIPLVIPSGSTVLFWKSFFDYNGALNGFITTLGGQKIDWLNSSLAMLVTIFIYLWKFSGYNMILFLSGLSSIPNEYYEAACIDGASQSQILHKITLPNLAPTFVIVIIMSIVNSFKVFKEIYLITGNYPHKSIYMLQHFMNNMFGSLNYPKLATATSILVLAIVPVALLLKKLERGAAT